VSAMRRRSASRCYAVETGKVRLTRGGGTLVWIVENEGREKKGKVVLSHKRGERASQRRRPKKGKHKNYGIKSYSQKDPPDSKLDPTFYNSRGSKIPRRRKTNC